MIALFVLLFTVYKDSIRVRRLKNDSVTDCDVTVDNRCKVTLNMIAFVNKHVIPVINTTKSGKPIVIEYGSDKVIDGINFGIRGSCIGEKREIIIPPSMAYGGLEVFGFVEPYSTWNITTEILGINPTVDV